MSLRTVLRSCSRRMPFRSSIRPALALALLGIGISLTGCGAANTAPAPPIAQPQVTVGGAGQVRLGATAQLTATVTNESSTAVTWQVNGVTGGVAATGTISATGLYTPPATIPAVNPVTITAISTAAPIATGTASETIWNPTPSITSAAATQSYGATTGALTLTGAGFVSGAQILVSGVAATTTFVSPTVLQATVSIAGGTTTLSVSVTNPNPGSVTTQPVIAQIQVIGQPQVAIGGAGQVRLGATAQLTATVTNETSTAVTWQVNGVTGGAAATGTISATGLYTPPAAIPAVNTVTITAISTVAPSVIGTASEAVWNPVPTVTSASATQSYGAATGFLTVTGTNFVSGAQILVGGVATATTFVSPTVLQASAAPIGTGATTLSIAVTNPDPGSATTATANAQIQIQTSLQSAARLLDQATFGPTLADIQTVQSEGIPAYLAAQFAAPATIEPDIPATPPMLCATDTVPCQQAEWWQAAITAPDQLRQRVAFALSEMFVVSTNSVNARSVTTFQNTLVNDAFSNFLTILHDVTLSPAMGAYLNMLHSAKPGVVNGVPQIANENYGRENMQLFTIGLDLLNPDGTLQLDPSGNPIPAYTEAQVQAFSRAYTGWTYATASGGSPTTFPNYTANYDSPMAPVEKQHDTLAKVLLNGTTLPAGQTAEVDLAGALANIFAHPNVGPFVCRQLIQHLVTSNPSPAYVQRVAAVFADDGTASHTRGNMQAVVQAILLDTEARAGDANPSFDGGHLREPILYITDFIRGLGLTFVAPAGGGPEYYSTLSNYSNALGEKPYASGSVFNFFPPDYVIPGTTTNAPEFDIENTASAVLRLTLINLLVFDQITDFNVDLSATSPLGIMASATGNATSDSTNLVKALSNIFMHGQMPAQMQTDIVNHVATLPNIGERVRVATYLTLTSSFYKVEH